MLIKLHDTTIHVNMKVEQMHMSNSGRYNKTSHIKQKYNKMATFGTVHTLL
jgi:hypothetical protein